jgi:hypothetical protein
MRAGSSDSGRLGDNSDSGTPAGDFALGMPAADGRLVMWAFLVLGRVHSKTWTVAPSEPSRAVRVVSQAELSSLPFAPTEDAELASALEGSEGKTLGSYPGHMDGSSRDEGLAGVSEPLGR